MQTYTCVKHSSLSPENVHIRKMEYIDMNDMASIVISIVSTYQYWFRYILEYTYP